jgi:hypothetical protein
MSKIPRGATADTPAFSGRIPDALQKKVDRQWHELFGAWQGFDIRGEG